MRPIKYTIILILLLSFIACDTGPSFIWNPDIKAIVNGDIDSWLKTAPFTGLWDPNDNKEGKTYVTNTREVFPFMGELINEDDNLYLINKEARPFYKQQYKVYKDIDWSESVVYAGLLYQKEELYMRSSYSKSGNIIVDGMQSINQRNYTDLRETQLVANTKEYKTAIYWVSGNGTTYLMGFYQKDQLVFQVAFPCTFDINGKNRGLKQLQNISKEMNLNIPLWNNATADQLAVAEREISFWKDPFEKFYFSHPFKTPLKIKLKETIFENETITKERSKNANYNIQHKKKTDSYSLTITKETTKMTSLEFSESDQTNTFENTANDNRAYQIQTIEQNGITIQTAKTYYKDNTLFTLTYTYPTSDIDNSSTLDKILGKLKVNTF